MQLTKQTDYTFRILIYLASMQVSQTQIQCIADEFKLSKSPLMKIVNKLVNHGWVEAQRGKNGGIKLAVAPEKISLSDVVKLAEPNLEPVNCTEPPCKIFKPCELKHILLQARENYLNYLNGYSLADLLNKKTTQILHFT